MKVTLSGMGAHRGTMETTFVRATRTMIVVSWGKGGSTKRLRRSDGTPVAWDGWSDWCIRPEELARVEAAIAKAEKDGVAL